MNLGKQNQLSQGGLLAVVASVFLALPFAVHGLELIKIEGLSEAQQSLADSIDDICPEISDGVTAGTLSLNSNQQGLFDACSAMIGTALRLQGVATADNPLSDFDLGSNITSVDQYSAALGQIAHEEVASNGTSFTETSQSQIGNIGTRLRSLRLGGAKFFSGFTLNLQNHRLPGELFSNAVEDSNSSAMSLNSGLSYYVNGTLATGNKEATSREDGFDFNTKGLTLGADYQIGRSGFVGLALGYAKLDSEITATATDEGMENQGYNISIYGTRFSKSTYINGILSIGQNNIDNKRTVPLIADTTDDGVSNFTVTGTESLSGETTANTMGLNIGAGVDSNIGPFSISRYAQLDYIRVLIDGYDEKGGSPLLLRVDEETINSFSSVVGLQASLATSTGFGVITDMIRLQWHHEFEDDSRKINADYLYNPLDKNFTFNAPTDNPDRNYFTAGIGATTVLPMGIQAFLYFEKTIGLANLDSQSIVFGVRKENF